ncbi:MAG: hypothetical protein NTY00_10610 [Deltaproteobacteria bacterium]|nr:hypothetical protein [Deltaproteobacteria bacterium]
MNKLVMVMYYLMVTVILMGSTAFAAQDEKGYKDHPAFTRMSGYWIHSCDQKQFDTHDFITEKGKTI